MSFPLHATDTCTLTHTTPHHTPHTHTRIIAIKASGQKGTISPIHLETFQGQTYLSEFTHVHSHISSNTKEEINLTSGMYTQAHTHAHTHAHTCTHTCTHACTHAQTHARTHAPHNCTHITAHQWSVPNKHELRTSFVVNICTMRRGQLPEAMANGSNPLEGRIS